MTDSSKEYFQNHAGDWDNLRSGYFQDAVRKVAVAHAYLRPEFKAADIGAGTGFMAAALAPLVKKVHVVDGSAEMLEVARRNLAAFKNISYLQSDGLTINLPDGSLDAVFANMYLHHCPDPLGAIREMARLLRPGGRLVITDSDSHPYVWMREEMADVWLGFDRGQIREWYRQAGLVNIIVDNTGETCCAAAEAVEIRDEKNRQASVTIFVAAGAKAISGMKEEVAREYRRHAVEGSSCGCSDSSSSSSCCSSGDQASGCCSSENGPVFGAVNYSGQTLASAPAEAVEMSLGCGNPLAIGDLRPGETVLDIGSGAGLDSFLAARKVGPQGRVIGVDMTAEMIARARATAEKNGLRQVEFRLGQAEELPVEDGSVDVILSNCVINLCEDKGRVFQEAFRVLKENGRLEISDMVSDGSFPARTDGQSWADCITGALPETEYIDLIKQAGFSVRDKLRSRAEQKLEGVAVYSLIVSAVKSGRNTGKKSCCG
ncbi:MAG: methyltransferase domain-containing protein [Anaerolineaceae bacterium]